MKTAVLAATAAMGLIAGCATKSEKIAPSYVSPIQYQGYSCRQISEEAARVSARAAQVSGIQDQAATNDAIGTTIGLFVLWPMLLFNEGDGANAAEVARLKGEMEALEQASIAKNCKISFQKAAPAKATEKVKAKD